MVVGVHVFVECWFCRGHCQSFGRGDVQIRNIGGMMTDSAKRKHWVRNPVKMPFCAPQILHVPHFLRWEACSLSGPLSYWLQIGRKNLSLLLSPCHIMAQPIGHRKGSGLNPIVISAVVMMDKTVVVQGLFPHANYFSLLPSRQDWLVKTLLQSLRSAWVLLREGKLVGRNTKEMSYPFDSVS